MTAASRVVEVMAWAPEIPGWNLPDPGETDWRDQALCTQTDPEVFFLEKGGSPRPAKRVCRECPVRAECLEYALENDERFGVWGGLTETERRRIKPPRTRDPACCHSGRHPRTASNTGAGGRCHDCRREHESAARAGGAVPSTDRRLAA